MKARAALAALVTGLMVILGLAVANPSSGAQARTNHTITRSHAVAIWKDTFGNVVCKQRYSASTQGKSLSVADSRCADKVMTTAKSHSGGSPSDSGSITVRISQTGQSTLGKDLWSMAISTNWYWSNSGTRALGVPGFGTTKAQHHDWRQAHRSWDKHSVGVDWQDWQSGGNAEYYSWADGWSHSGFHHREVGKFLVPNALSGVNWEYPTNWINSHTNGTWDWDTSCKC